MKIEVGVWVKIIGGYDGGFIGCEGVVIEDVNGIVMVISKEGLLKNMIKGDDFYLYFMRCDFEFIVEFIFIIKFGKYYCICDGEKVGLMVYDGVEWYMCGDGCFWSKCGEWWVLEGYYNNIIEEWIEEEIVFDILNKWGGMMDVEVEGWCVCIYEEW